MQRVILALAIASTFMIAVIGVFVVHGTMRSGCAEARNDATLAWLAVAAVRTDPAAAEAAAAAAAGDYLALEASTEGTPTPKVRDHAVAASTRAIAICR